MCGPKLGKQQHRSDWHHQDTSEEEDDGDNERADSDSEASGSEDEGHPSTAARAKSHAAAAPGPSSTAAAPASTKKQKAASSKKRAAAVAFQDAISLLPPDLDVETLVRIRQQLQPRNRMQKQALLQTYRQQYQQWRFLLRWVGSAAPLSGPAQGYCRASPQQLPCAVAWQETCNKSAIQHAGSLKSQSAACSHPVTGAGMSRCRCDPPVPPSGPTPVSASCVWCMCQAPCLHRQHKCSRSPAHCPASLPCAAGSALVCCSTALAQSARCWRRLLTRPSLTAVCWHATGCLRVSTPSRCTATYWGGAGVFEAAAEQYCWLLVGAGPRRLTKLYLTLKVFALPASCAAWGCNGTKTVGVSSC